jgi:hypothetical protein
LFTNSFYTESFNIRLYQLKYELFMLNVGRIQAQSDCYRIKGMKDYVSAPLCVILKGKEIKIKLFFLVTIFYTTYLLVIGKMHTLQWLIIFP